MSVLPQRGNNLATVLISAMCIRLLVKQLFSAAKIQYLYETTIIL